MLRSVVAPLAALVLLLTACQEGDGTSDADGEASSVDGDAAPDPVGPDPTLPRIAFIDPDEVDVQAEAGTVDALVAEVAPELPDGWQVAVVSDPLLGPFVVGVPTGTPVWRAGDDVTPVAEATDDTSWSRYWLPRMDDVNAEADASSLRTILVLDGLLDGGDGEVVSVQVNVTGTQDLPITDARAVADAFAATFEQQELQVEAVDVARAGAREVGTVRFLTPEGEFDDGVAREVEQWFHPEEGAQLLWSLSCDAPTTRADEVADACRSVLASFRPPPR